MHWIDAKLVFIQTKIKENIKVHGNLFPEPASVHLNYKFGENVSWTPSFWTGMMWLSYELTGEAIYRQVIEAHLESFNQRLKLDIEMDNHDIGFYFSLSHIPEYRLNHASDSRKIIVAAADKLVVRYLDVAGIIQAWGDPDDSENRGRIIIDCNMNLCLLYEAYQITGDRSYYDKAYAHIKNAQKYLVREDNSTHHTYYFDSETGEPLRGTTAQGYSDSSCWSRGQAWAVYGFALNYLYTDDESLLETALANADYFLRYLPEDDVPYWDLYFTSGDEYRDTSAGSILACGLLELAKHLPITDERRSQYEETAYSIVRSLSEHYTTEGEAVNGFVKHAVYSIPNDLGIDECCLWGDYYYYEALVRLRKVWKPYW